MKLTALIPARFLFMISHVILLITVMQSRVENVKAGLPLDHGNEEYSKRDSQYLGGLIAGIILTAFELIGFITGVSMFASLPSVISTLCHSSASICLISLVIDGWDSQIYWLVFVLCSVLPAMIEVCVMVNVMVLKKF